MLEIKKLLKFKTEDIRDLVLKKWQSEVPPQRFIKGHLCIAIVVGILSLLCFVWDSRTQEHSWRYDEHCGNKLKQYCYVTIKLTEMVPANSILFLRLIGFRQSNRKIINSWSHEQMSGSTLRGASETKPCEPDVTNRDMEKYWSVDGTKLDPNAVSYPCGLLAKYFPQDTFEFFQLTSATPAASDLGSKVPISTESISWEGLQGNKFRSVNKSREWVSIDNEQFINWMRPNTFHHVHKSWGRFLRDTPPGTYTVRIYNDLNPEVFSGQKVFGIAVLSPLGGSNPIVPITLLIISLASLLLVAIFQALIKIEQSVEMAVSGHDPQLAREALLSNHEPNPDLRTSLLSAEDRVADEQDEKPQPEPEPTESVDPTEAEEAPTIPSDTQKHEISQQ